MADVLLIEVGPRIIEVIKAVRAITRLGLKEAKDLVESAPAVVRRGLSDAEADHARRQLQEAGAWAEVRESVERPDAPPPTSDGSVYLVDAGRNKIMVIKTIREAMGLGLREAKDLVDSAPVLVVSGWDDGEAAALKSELEAAGARVS
jgi:ribosomal protein L7/L12